MNKLPLVGAFFLTLAGSFVFSGALEFSFNSLSFPLLLLLLGLSLKFTAEHFAKSTPSAWWKKYQVDLILSLGFTLYAVLFVAPAMRILTDESNLVVTSLELFLTKKASIPLAMLFEHGIPLTLGSEVPVRPLALPFLASLLHSLFNFKIEHVYWVNLLGLWLFAFALCRIVEFFKGSRLIKAAALLLVFSHPIVFLSFRSASLEALFITFATLSAYYFLRLGQEKKFLVPFALACAWTLQTRYEAIFAISGLVVLALVQNLTALQKDLKEKTFTYLAIFAATLPFWWQRVLLLKTTDQNFSAYSGKLKAHLSGSFSASYLGTNLFSLKQALLDFHSPQLFSPWLNFVALLALGYLLFTWKQHKRTPLFYAGLSLFSIPLLHLAFMLFYVAGEAAEPITARLFLTLFIALSLLSLLALRKWLKETTLVTLAGLSFFLCLNETKKQDYNQTGIFNRLTSFVESYYSDQKLGPSDLLVTSITSPFIAREWSVIPPKFAQEQIATVKKILQEGRVRSLIWVDVVYLSAPETAPIPPDFGLRPVLLAKRNVDHGVLARIWELKLP